jgi:hypothetical protein
MFLLKSVQMQAAYIVGSGGPDALNRSWLVEKRSSADGAIIWQDSFSTGASAGADIGTAVIAGADGVFFAGRETTNGLSWRVEKRNPQTGAVLMSYLKGASGDELPRAMALDGNGSLYVVGDFTSSGRRWLIEKRSTSNLAHLWTKSSAVGETVMLRQLLPITLVCMSQEILSLTRIERNR